MKNPLISIVLSLVILVGTLSSSFIANAVSDTTPPVLNSVTVDKKTVNPNETVKIELELEDDISGVESAFINYQMGDISKDIRKFVRIGYNSTTKKWEGFITPNEYEAGVWSLYSIYVVDKAGNGVNFLRGENPLVPNGNFEVISAVSDTTPPVLNSVTVDKKTVNPNETVKIELELEDDISGVESAFINYQMGDISKDIRKFVRIGYNSTTKKWEGFITPNEYEAGVWSLYSIYAVDKAGNGVNFLRGENPLVPNGNFEVISAVSDTTPPVLNTVTVDKKTVNPNETVKIELELEDDISGVESAFINYQMGDISKDIRKFVRVGYNSTTKKWEGFITPNEYEEGVWSLYSIYAVDKAGNGVNFLRGENSLVPNGNFEVVSAVSETTPISFIDVTKQYTFYEEVQYLSSAKVIAGFADGTFRPNDIVTRAQAAIMIGRAIGLSGEPRDSKFEDVSSSVTGSGYIASAVEKAIINGFADGTYRPNHPVTRGQMAIFLDRAFTLTHGQTNPFKDVYFKMAAYQSILNVSVEGIASGYKDGTYRPEQPVTRGQFSAFMARTLDSRFRTY